MRDAGALLVAIVLTAGCGGVGQPAAPPDGAPTGDLVVFAAASLTDAFAEIADAFAAAHPDVRVLPNFAGSQTLARQIAEGAPADVFAAADGRALTAITDRLEGDPIAFAGNVMTIAVEPGNPLAIEGLADLARPDVTLVVAEPHVPAGHHTLEVLDNAGVSASPASLEVDVRAALSKVVLGSADAAIVFASDVAAAGAAVDEVVIPLEHNSRAEYPIAILAGARNPAAARAFVRFVTSPAGAQILARHGFRRP